MNFTNTCKVMYIADVNDVFMTCSMVFLTSETNLNKVRYTEAFIDEVVANQEDYVGIPLVVDLQKLLRRDFNNLTHLFKNGRFGTTQIGSFCSFSKFVREDGVIELRADARIPKRNTEVCGILTELHTSDEGLKFSYEISVSESTEIDGVTVVDAGGGYPIGSCVVSVPAVPDAVCKTLVAELIGLEGDKMENVIYISEKTDIQVAELTREQMDVKIRRAFDKIDEKYHYDLYICGIFSDYIAAFCCKTGNFYKFSYEMVEDEIVINPEPEMVEMTFVAPESVVAVAEVEAKEAEFTAQLAEKETVIAEKETQLVEKETKIAQMNEEIIAIGEKMTEANQTIETLQAAKEQLDTILAEQAEKANAECREKLRAKCEKVLDEAEMTQVAELIEAMDEQAINAVLAEKYVASVVEEKSADVKIAAFDSMNAGSKNKYITLN